MTEGFRYEGEAAGADVSLLERYLPPAEPINDAVAFTETLESLNGGPLEQAGLPAGFNRVYSYLSREILSNLREEPTARERYKPFDYPDDVEHTMGIFGEHYFRALRSYVAHHKGDEHALDSMSPAWRYALLDPKVQRSVPGIQFLAGMITHISARDLAASLVESDVRPEYYGDYTSKVNDHIVEATIDLAPEMIPGHPVIWRSQVAPITLTIAGMRELAWRDSTKLTKLATDEDREAMMQKLDARAARLTPVVTTLGGAALSLTAKTANVKLPNLASSERALRLVRPSLSRMFQAMVSMQKL